MIDYNGTTIKREIGNGNQVQIILPMTKYYLFARLEKRALDWHRGLEHSKYSI